MLFFVGLLFNGSLSRWRTSWFKRSRILVLRSYDSFSPLAVILVGETSLRTILRVYHMSAIWCRVETGYHLSALDFEQTKKYINHQLKSAGCGRWETRRIRATRAEF